MQFWCPKNLYQLKPFSLKKATKLIKAFYVIQYDKNIKNNMRLFIVEKKLKKRIISQDC